MRLRMPAALLIVAAAALQLGYTMPARARSRAAADTSKRLRDERREAAVALAASQRRQAALAAALEAASGPGASRDGAVADARQAIVAALSGARMSDVHLSVRPGAAPSAAVAQVSGVGSFRDIIAFSSQVLEPGSGLALDEARFKPVASGVVLELSLVRVGGGP